MGEQQAALLSWFAMLIVALAASAAAARHPVPKEHPRLLGSKAELQALKRERPEAYQRVVSVAKAKDADDHTRMISLGLAYAIDGDEASGQEAKRLAMKYVEGPIKKGHIPFGADLALCAYVYDLCHPCFTAAERAKLHEYVNKTVEANVGSETHVFHNAWYGYKNWGIGLAAYATYYENPQAPSILKTLEEDYFRRAAPALELSGSGGGFAEGYYIHYWLYEWLLFCEAARRCEGVDYYAAAPNFYRQRAVASMFEMYPGLGEYGSRQPIPMGDGGGRRFGGDRDKALYARRILASYFRDDPAHQAVHAFNETTPRPSIGNNAYKMFLFNDASVPKGNLASFKLSHYSPGPGYVYARSSWNDDATHFYFKCGDRFTAHQHLDVGHFTIFKHEELAGDGGHYDEFGTKHDVNYHLRTIAHSTMLVYDPAETFKGIRGAGACGNDGGQSHCWAHHNGAFGDVEDWKKRRDSADIAEMLAFEDRQAYVYMAGDCTRAYSPKKLAEFVRQIVYLRPNTFVVFDRVKSKDASFKKTWLLQAMKKPEGQAPNLVITNGKGRLFVQTLLPQKPEVRLVSGDDLYRYDGNSYPPKRDTGPAPECRIEVSPSEPAVCDYFLHVLTAAEAVTASVPQATVKADGEQVVVTVGDYEVALNKLAIGGTIAKGGKRVAFATQIPTPQ